MLFKTYLSVYLMNDIDYLQIFLSIVPTNEEPPKNRKVSIKLP